MNPKNDISEELRSLSELVATVSRQTPYRVADDYFSDFPARVLLRVKTQHKPLTFSVPEGYFEGFAQGLMARIKAGAGRDAGIARDATAASPLLPEDVDTELTALSPLLAQLRHLGTFQAPEGYFEEISPILALTRGKNPYSVPEEYFHGLPAEIEARVGEPSEQQQQGKVITLGGRRTNWWKYSAAAVVAGLIVTIGWLRLHVSGGDHHPASVDIAATLPKVSDQELQSFLADQDTTLAQPTNNTATLDFNDGNLKSLLGDVPDGELKQYMEEHGGSNDIATN